MPIKRSRWGRPQVSLAGLLAVALTLAAFLGAFYFPTSLVSRFVFSGTILLLFGAMAGGLWCEREVRRRWGAFAIFGMAYFALAFAPGLREHIGEMLVTTELLDFANPIVTPLEPGVSVEYRYAGHEWTESEIDDVVGKVQNGVVELRANGNPSNFQNWQVSEVEWRVRRVHFLRIGQSMFALIFGLLGSLFVQVFFPIRRDEDHAEQIQPAPQASPRTIPEQPALAGNSPAPAA